MSKKIDIHKHKINVRGKNVYVWPSDTDVVEITDSPMTYTTQFTDTDKYHDKLKERIFELEKKEEHTHRVVIGGNKVRYVHEWETAEAKLIDMRAKAFFARQWVRILRML